MSDKTKKRKDPAAVTLGRRGGKRGGAARMAALTKRQRTALARKGAAARWKKAKDVGAAVASPKTK